MTLQVASCAFTPTASAVLDGSCDVVTFRRDLVEHLRSYGSDLDAIIPKLSEHIEKISAGIRDLKADDKVPESVIALLGSAHQELLTLHNKTAEKNLDFAERTRGLAERIPRSDPDRREYVLMVATVAAHAGLHDEYAKGHKVDAKDVANLANVAAAQNEIEALRQESVRMEESKRANEDLWRTISKTLSPPDERT